MHVMIIGAHPDDAEFSAGGTAIKFRNRGDSVKIVSVTNGNKGHFSEEYKLDPEKLAERRRTEARSSSALIGAEWETLDVDDGEVHVTQELTEEMVRTIRTFGEPGRGPDLVIINRPVDYHRDHRNTAQIVLDAAYMLTVPLYCPETRHLDSMPVFAYWWDRFEEIKAFRPDIVVPIDDVIETKIDMLMCHVSQVFEWLPYNANRLAEVPDDPVGRREFLAESIKARGRNVRNHCEKKLRELFGAKQFDFAEAYQISQYGRQPGASELSDLFPL